MTRRLRELEPHASVCGKLLDARVTCYGRVTIAVRAQGRLIRYDVQKNILTAAAPQRFARAIAGEDLGTLYIAVGDGTTQPSPADTALENELGRWVASQEAAGAATRLTTLIAPLELAGETLAEAGVFWDGAGAGVGSGILMARTLINPPIDKTAQMSVQIIWEWGFVVE